MSETLIERIKRWNDTKPNDLMNAFSSDLYEIVTRMESAERERDSLSRGMEYLSFFIEPHFKGATGRFMNAQEIAEWIHQRSHDYDELLDANDILMAGARKVIQNTGWCPCCDSDHGHAEECPMKGDTL